jgi:hypothetical protein
MVVVLVVLVAVPTQRAVVLVAVVLVKLLMELVVLELLDKVIEAEM